MSIANFRKILEVKSYSENTITTYTSFLKKTEGHFNRPIDTLTETDLFPFVHEQIHTKGLSRSTLKQLIGTIKLYFKEVLNQEIDFQTMLPNKVDSVLPEVLSQQEIIRILQCTRNVKHKAVLALLYSSGFKIGEVINLKITDIDSDRMTIRVRGGKGAKDRIVPLSTKLHQLLRVYFKQHKPSMYLFEGQKGRAQYSTSGTIQFIKKYAKRAGITKNVTAHTFRHSYATHLLAKGIDIRIIQGLLGHNNINSTMIYTLIAKPKLLSIESPLDSLDFDTPINPSPA